MTREDERKLELLRRALVEGEESGPSLPFDFESFIAKKRAAPPAPSVEESKRD